VRRAQRSRERDGQGAEELQRHRQPQPDAVDRGVQGEVHDPEHRGERQHGPPLRGGELPQARPPDGQHQHPGYPLPHGDDADGPDHREGEGPESRSGLAAQSAAEHQRGSRHTAPRTAWRRRSRRYGGPDPGVDVHASSMTAAASFEK
jgi:hypothetical protein